MITQILLVLAVAVSWLSLDAFAQAQGAEDEPILQDQKAKNSYAVGVQVGNKLKVPSMDLDAESVARGVKDALTGARTRMSLT